METENETKTTGGDPAPGATAPAPPAPSTKKEGKVAKAAAKIKAAVTGKKSPVKIPDVTVLPIAHTVTTPAPVDAEYTHGIFKRLADGLPYAVAVHEPDTYGRTHTAKNSANFWQGDETQFRLQFDKE